ncbi:MAG: hypothetical protein J3K34DRAFT_431436 [Monoraphidium minutum]|nr:MAG: hypothetical protein J3K34DRAFT_431436 [Monoraphidium minutum]
MPRAPTLPAAEPRRARPRRAGRPRAARTGRPQPARAAAPVRPQSARRGGRPPLGRRPGPPPHYPSWPGRVPPPTPPSLAAKPARGRRPHCAAARRRRLQNQSVVIYKSGRAQPRPGQTSPLSAITLHRPRSYALHACCTPRPLPARRHPSLPQRTPFHPRHPLRPRGRQRTSRCARMGFRPTARPKARL